MCFVAGSPLVFRTSCSSALALLSIHNEVFKQEPESGLGRGAGAVHLVVQMISIRK